MQALPSIRALLRFPLAVLLFSFARTTHAQFMVPDQQYRCDPTESSCKAPEHLPWSEDLTSREGNPFSLNFVEFRDNGVPWQPAELKAAITRIRSVVSDTSEQSAVVVVYIHGWENNADEPRGTCRDVCKFRDTLLTRLADEQGRIKAAGGVPSKVIGIYLGWRGLTFTAEPFKHFFSYWPRRGVARRVGRTGMYDALLAIENAVKPARSRYVLVLAGHSFGSRALENATEMRDPGRLGLMYAYREDIREEAKRQRSGLTILNNPSLPADLIFYVNAATSSAVTRRTVKEIQGTCREVRNFLPSPMCKADPFYLAVTSRADLATGIILPIANAVLPALSDHLRLLSAANTPSLHTHNTVANCNPQMGVCFSVTSTDQYTVVPIASRKQIPGAQETPFWIFNVGKDVMKDHGDVWNAAVTDLAVQIITRTTRYQALASR